jgi:hypothetical protein
VLKRKKKKLGGKRCGLLDGRRKIRAVKRGEEELARREDVSGDWSRVGSSTSERAWKGCSMRTIMGLMMSCGLAEIEISRNFEQRIETEKAHVVSVIISRYFVHFDVPRRLKLFESVRVMMLDPVRAGPHDLYTVFSAALPAVRLDDIVVVFEKDAAKRGLFCLATPEDEETHFA